VLGFAGAGFNQVIREQFALTDGTHDVLSELLDVACFRAVVHAMIFTAL
jgi:hypothetical protein